MPAARAAPSTAKTVMIVEDNELNMKLFNDLLRANGYNTLPMRNGYARALDALKEHSPDLIIMDIQLPEISGLRGDQADEAGPGPDTSRHSRRRRHCVRDAG